MNREYLKVGDQVVILGEIRNAPGFESYGPELENFVSQGGPYEVYKVGLYGYDLGKPGCDYFEEWEHMQQIPTQFVVPMEKEMLEPLSTPKQDD